MNPVFGGGESQIKIACCQMQTVKQYEGLLVGSVGAPFGARTIRGAKSPNRQRRGNIRGPGSADGER